MSPGCPFEGEDHSRRRGLLEPGEKHFQRTSENEARVMLRLERIIVSSNGKRQSVARVETKGTLETRQISPRLALGIVSVVPRSLYSSVVSGE